MKSDRQHELKTNELAEWISNLPQWTKENRTTIIGVLVVIAVVAALYFWKIYKKTMVSNREQLRLTSLISQLPYNEIRILEAHSQGSDLSYILLQPAEGLETFAQSISDDQMAALALIKRAEALRMELHYRIGAVGSQELTEQINRAKTSYTEALKRASSNPSLKAAAKFGLGLCEEELGNFEEAQQIYQDIAESSDLEATVAKAAAKHRLETMADYKDKVVFKTVPIKPAAKPELMTAPKPVIEIKPVEMNLPIETNLPGK